MKSLENAVAEHKDDIGWCREVHEAIAQGKGIVHFQQVYGIDIGRGHGGNFSHRRRAENLVQLYKGVGPDVLAALEGAQEMVYDSYSLPRLQRMKDGVRREDSVYAKGWVSVDEMVCGARTYVKDRLKEYETIPQFGGISGESDGCILQRNNSIGASAEVDGGFLLRDRSLPQPVPLRETRKTSREYSPLHVTSLAAVALLSIAVRSREIPASLEYVALPPMSAQIQGVIQKKEPKVTISGIGVVLDDGNGGQFSTAVTLSGVDFSNPILQALVEGSEPETVLGTDEFCEGGFLEPLPTLDGDRRYLCTTGRDENGKLRLGSFFNKKRKKVGSSSTS